jgi:hypothetical protein
MPSFVGLAMPCSLQPSRVMRDEIHGSVPGIRHYPWTKRRRVAQRVQLA